MHGDLPTQGLRWQSAGWAVASCWKPYRKTAEDDEGCCKSSCLEQGTGCGSEEGNLEKQMVRWRALEEEGCCSGLSTANYKEGDQDAGWMKKQTCWHPLLPGTCGSGGVPMQPHIWWLVATQRSGCSPPTLQTVQRKMSTLPRRSW